MGSAAVSYEIEAPEKKAQFEIEPPKPPDSTVLGSVKKGLSNVFYEGPKSLYHAIADPATPSDEDVSGAPWERGARAFNRIFVDPSLRTQEKARAATNPVEKAGYYGASLMPGSEWIAAKGEQAGRGDIKGAALETATTLAAPYAAGKLISAGAPVLGRGLKAGAGAINNAVIDAPGRASQYGANPGAGMAAEHVTGFRPGTIAERLEAPIAARGQQLTDLYTAPQVRGTTLDLRNALNEPFNKAIGQGTEPMTGVAPKALVNRLARTQREITTEPLTGAPRDLSAVTPEQALQLKRNLADRTKFNKAEYSEGVNDVLRQTGGNLKTALNTAVPEGVPLNRRLSDLYAARDVMTPQAMNYKGGRLWSNLPGNAVRGVGTNVASGMYRLGEALAPEPLPTAATMQPRGGMPPAYPPGTSSPQGGYVPPAPPTSKPQGGHAGGGVSSVEELNRPGINYTVSKGGQVTYHGKAFAPEGTKAGATHVTVMPDGSLRVNAGQQLTAGQEAALRNALKK